MSDILQMKSEIFTRIKELSSRLLPWFEYSDKAQMSQELLYAGTWKQQLLTLSFFPSSFMRTSDWVLKVSIAGEWIIIHVSEGGEKRDKNSHSLGFLFELLDVRNLHFNHRRGWWGKNPRLRFLRIQSFLPGETGRRWKKEPTSPARHCSVLERNDKSRDEEKSLTQTVSLRDYWSWKRP